MAKDFSQYKLNINRSPVDERDFKLKTFLTGPVDFPPTLDLRPDLQPVRDQGPYGTCAAMSGAAMKEWQENKDIQLNEYLSPQFIYYNREDPSQEGMYMRDLMKILNKMGVCREEEYPYGSKEKPSSVIYEWALDFIVGSYASVDTIDELKASLYLNGPAVIAVPVYNYGNRMWYQRAGDSFLGGHAMCIVGYNEEGFIIRNSWGDDWNNGGYTIFPYSDWGLQWEVWTTVDAMSDPDPDPDPEPEPEPQGCLNKLTFIYLAIAVAVVIAYL